MKYPICRSFSMVMVMTVLTFGAAVFSVSNAAITPMSDKALSSVEAQASPIHLSVERDTFRIFLDAYIEIYQETDRVRLGYYYRSPADLTTRKGLNPGDYERYWRIWSGTDGYHWKFNDGDPRINWHLSDIPVRDGKQWNTKHFRVNMGKNSSGNTVYTPWQIATEYTLWREDGSSGNFSEQTIYVPWVDDDNYLYKFKVSTGDKWVDGAQGDNSELVLFSSQPYRNRNYLDWDFSVDNLRMGISPEEPARINGLVIRLKYDNINDPNRKLTDIIVGTNDLQGDLSFDYKRATGIYSPKLPHQARQPCLQSGTADNNVPLVGKLPDLSVEFNGTPIPAIYIRDTMMSLVDQFNLSRNYKQPDIDNRMWMDAVPDNPLSNTQHSGFFVRIGLDRNSPHFGYQLVGGYSERVATAFQYKGEWLNESMYRWWNGLDPSPETHQYPAVLKQVYHNDLNVTGYPY